MGSIIEEQLKRFFINAVGIYHASNVEAQLFRYIPFMKEYPQIVEQYISRFRHYFTQSPVDNHVPALRCLIEIAKEAPQVRARIIEDFGSVLDEYRPFWKELTAFNELLKILELPVSEKDKYLRDLARSVITLRQPLILIIGAGFSYDTMPITSELQPLLITLLQKVSISSPMKMIQENDEQVWKIVKGNSATFKDMFSGWCARTKPAPQHKIVAKMLHIGQISHLISFNWDDLIERAYLDEFSQNISKVVNDGIIPERPSLWKLHGDVADLSSDWIFPYEQGRIFNSLIESLKQIVNENCPQFALIVGYSEWEKVVHDRLSRWLEGNIPTVLRVRPNWDEKDPGGICETAKRFFERLNIYFEMEVKSH